MMKLVLPKGDLNARNKALLARAIELGWEVEYLDDTTGGLGLGPVYVDECTDFSEADWDRISKLAPTKEER